MADPRFDRDCSDSDGLCKECNGHSSDCVSTLSWEFWTLLKCSSHLYFKELVLFAILVFVIFV